VPTVGRLVVAAHRAGTYSASIDKPTGLQRSRDTRSESPEAQLPGAHTMNTTRQAPTQRFAAFALALMMTLGMLGAVDHLATSDAPGAQLARAEAAVARS
jgi:hypothetical protein